ncbi:MAG: hypothetical protein AUK47_10500 [Deltaproteobacteria bacterium CG2_30_63_29]|nr:MAG: hypothetical protein AUK47_10500 [Deltaproteobacteria bacterium CG2_30_63_29]PIW00724.1 MAG: hypothetical protein COW42_06930 [Deltaproteobacteria bacterium CG17_big_fil_post_rev_8_21_14_2_50_63_7]PJB33551.1 MAG: hypothetical protein CO108_30735 [Deltaproteobacteria bacterium CG_4_9_14_3_um_filter_63_12]
MNTDSKLRALWSVGRFHIVAIATMGLLTFGWLFTGRLFPMLAATCALDWFLVNLLNRVVDLEEDRANRIVGTDFVSRHRRVIFWVGVSLLASSLAASALLSPAILPLRLAFHALGFAYNWKLVPGLPRIKQLYFFKNTASATGFMLTVFGFPLLTAAAEGIPLMPDVTALTVAVVATFFFLFELSYEVVYDLRDAEGDRLAGVHTYPAVHGARVSTHLIDALLAASAVALVAGYAAGIVPWRAFVMVLAPALQLVLYKRWVKRGVQSDDCITITWLGAGLLGAYQLWIAAGLPLTLADF